MFKFEEIRELILLVGSTPIASLEIERADMRLRIEGHAAPEPARTPTTAPVVTPGRELQSAPTGEAASHAGDEEHDSGLHRVTSPIVGTFYSAPNPDGEPFVKVGDVVGTGQVLCIVEAMKLMNEIECDQPGTIVKVVPDNAQAVEFGSVLFLVRPG